MNIPIESNPVVTTEETDPFDHPNPLVQQDEPEDVLSSNPVVTGSDEEGNEPNPVVSTFI